MLIEKNLTHSGDRLRRARILAGIATRREFEKKYQISANTLQGWEQGKNPLSKKGARRIIEALKTEGLICSMEWLMNGAGMPPRPFEMVNPGLISSNNDMETALTKANLHEEQAIYEELQTFKANNPNPIIITISDDTMEPQYRSGDYIAGTRICVLSEMTAYFGQACIVELEDHTIMPRYVHPGSEPNTVTLSCTNYQSKNPPLNMFNVKVISIAPILWHRKKLTTLKI